MCYFNNSFYSDTKIHDNAANTTSEYEDKKELKYAMPFPSFGFDLFPTSLVHVTFDAKYIYPLIPLRGGTEDHTWSGWIFSAGMTTNW